MEIDYAMLADSAQVADGKTYILGGGVSILWRPTFPAVIGCALVVQLTYDREEAATHQLRIVVIDADGNKVLPDLEGEIGLGPGRGDLPGQVPLVAPLVLGFPPMPVLQREGAYDVKIYVDGRHLKTLPFAVVRSEAPGRAPADAP